MEKIYICGLICTKVQADSVAQPVEQRSFKPWVLGSNPSAVTRKHFENRGAFFIFNQNILSHSVFPKKH